MRASPTVGLLQILVSIGGFYFLGFWGGIIVTVVAIMIGGWIAKQMYG